MATRYRIDGLPATFWINRDGIVTDAESGFGGPAALERKTRRLVDSK